MASKPFYRTLYFQVLIAIAIGVMLGAVAPDHAIKYQPLSDGFIKLIKMVIAPVIFCTVVTGIAGMERAKHAGLSALRYFILAIVYFFLATTLALAIGLVVVNIVKPGVGLNFDIALLNIDSIAKYTKPTAVGQGVADFLLHVIPNTLVSAFVDGEILQVLLVSLLFGFALHATGDSGQVVLRFIESVSQVLFKIVEFVMKVAPIGAFGAMAFVVGKYGIGALKPLAGLMLCFYATCLFFIFIVLGAVAYLHGFSIFRLVRYLRDELLVVLGTSSSESVLPKLMEKLTNLGCKKSLVGLVVPTGYSFNLDGTCIYLTVAAVFLAQATETPLDVSQQVAMLLVLLIASKGAAAVTGGGLIVLAATLPGISHIPIISLALIVGIDRFMSEARALTNLIGNGVATIVVAKWCKQIDESQLRERL